MGRPLGAGEHRPPFSVHHESLKHAEAWTPDTVALRHAEAWTPDTVALKHAEAWTPDKVAPQPLKRILHKAALYHRTL